MSPRSAREPPMEPTGLQGVPVEVLSNEKYVQLAEFRAGYKDRAATKPPRKFSDDWVYEDGRAVANALLAKGIDPTKVSLVDQAVWLLRLTLDGTIISDRPGAPCGSHS
jgi:hypothetical protein